MAGPRAFRGPFRAARVPMAAAFGILRKTVQEDWKVAKVWLRRELG